MKFKVRFNKMRGQAGRGTAEHVWRVFDENKEYLFKHLDIRVPVKSEKEEKSDDWNIVCEGILKINRELSIAIIMETHLD